MTAVPTFTLRPGHEISRVIRGGWQLAGGHGPVDRAQTIADMVAFAEAGIVTFDCADIYTGVEEMIGAFRMDYLHTHATDIATVASAAMLERPAVAAVIVGARNRSHLARNLQVASLKLTEADRAEIGAVLAQGQVPEGDTYTLERDRGGRHGQIIKYNLNKAS